VHDEMAKSDLGGRGAVTEFVRGISSTAAEIFFDCRSSEKRTALATGLASAVTLDDCVCAAGGGCKDICAGRVKGQIAANIRKRKTRFIFGSSVANLAESA
jgi:hypothetical protein